MINVTVLDDYQGAVPHLRACRHLSDLPVKLQVMQERISDANALVAALADTDCLVLIRERTRLTADILQALPRLRLIVQTGRMTDCIDLDACRKQGIEVRDGTGNPIAPVELTWALILAASRRITDYATGLQQGRWQCGPEGAAHTQSTQLGRSLNGRTLGIWGYGKIGRRVAAIGQALGMRVVAHGRENSRQSAEADQITYISDRRTFLQALDVLSLHLRLCEATRHFITLTDLLTLRQDALLVNTSRAELIAPGALLQALAQGHPGQAALDVFEDEPQGVQPYLGHPNILCTPHIGFVEQNTYEAYFEEAFTHVRQFLRN